MRPQLTLKTIVDGGLIKYRQIWGAQTPVRPPHWRLGEPKICQYLTSLQSTT